jgi:hypothetical protein
MQGEEKRGFLWTVKFSLAGSEGRGNVCGHEQK